MTWIQGETLTETLLVLEIDGTPTPGLTFETLTADDPNGDTFELTVEGLGNGVYRFSTPTTATSPTGNWFASVQADDTYISIFEIEWVLSPSTVVPQGGMDWKQGDRLTDTITLTDTDGLVITGATFETIAAHDPNGSAFTLSYDELGDGSYRFYTQTLYTSPKGNWFAAVRANDARAQVFSLSWVLSGNASARRTGTTRRELRRMILGKIGDFTLTTATASSGSSQWTDVDALTFGDSGRYAGRELYVSGGTPNNLGELRAISGSNAAGILQLTRTLPASVSVGDEAEIVNTYGQGMRIPDVHRAINDTLVHAGTELRASVDVATAFDADTRTIEIPSTWTAIDGVYYQSAHATGTLSWEVLQRAQGMHGEGWSIDHENRLVFIGGMTGYRLNGASIRLTGWERPAALETDEDATPVNAEWITARVLSDLYLRGVGVGSRASTEWERKGFFWEQTAERLRDMTRPRRSSNHVKI